MKEIIILITALILGATTCNAQFARGFAKGTANAAKSTPKVLNKYKVPIIVGIGVGSARLQKDRQQHTPITGMSHPYLLSKELLAPTAVKKMESIKTSLPCAAVLSLSRDSVNSYRHIPTVLPIDTVYVLGQDSTVQRTDK